MPAGDAVAVNSLAVNGLAANTFVSHALRPGAHHVQEYSDTNRRRSRLQCGHSVAGQKKLTDENSR
jgi:hypothetical protein